MSIVKFDQTIQLFQSQRHPIKITIYGSNGKSYDFLMKFGEDLRQDQRIQQILSLMSQKLQYDQHCRLHRLFLRTFECIPITHYCGLLSWVKNTKELHDFIFTHLHRNCNVNTNTENATKEDVQNAYAAFIREPIKRLQHQQQQSNNATDYITMAYGTAACTYTREQIHANFRNLENLIDLNLLKYALVEISVSPESFFVLRSNFAKSLATMNIAHWILGIGDRHLKNILINIRNASLTGIDFNCTFGTAARNLRIPELIPFRLTPHLVHLMDPMGTSGLIFKCMVHTLRVFRACEKLLLACMEVFIREPTVNWIKSHHEKKRNNDEVEDNMTESSAATTTTTTTTSFNWEPKDRIDIAKCKLHGYNPVHLIERELKVGEISRFAEYLEGYIKILKGNQQFNIRARLSKDNLSVEQQVKCLIDLATDPAILGITYEGFMPWM